jgi:DNA-binding transcriptional LysR family regulator
LPELEGLLQRQEIDFAVTLFEAKLPGGINGVPLLKLPLGLLVPATSRIQSVEELWKRDRIEDTLISLPEAEPIARHFQEGLARLGVDWFPRIEVSSLDVLEAYVANGYGIGLTVVVPKRPASERVRLLPLTDFPPAVIGALWQGKRTPLTQAFLNILQERAKALTA